MTAYRHRPPPPTAAAPHARADNEFSTEHGVRIIVREPVRGWDVEVGEEDDTPAPVGPQVVVLPANQSAADRAAFVQYIHDQWGDFIWGKLRQQGWMSNESRKDLVQRVLFVVNRCLVEQPAPEHPGAWLGEIIRLEVSNHRQIRRLDVDSEADADAVIASGLGPESAALLAELWSKLDGYLRRLDPEDAEVVKLKDLAEMTFEEIAEALGEPRATVAYRHERAIEKLRAMALRSVRRARWGAHRSGGGRR
ncbi:MAG: sigma-70 family RNA polymerase sigma factor [Byssovorax sp.]